MKGGSKDNTYWFKVQGIQEGDDFEQDIVKPDMAVSDHEYRTRMTDLEVVLAVVEAQQVLNFPPAQGLSLLQLECQHFLNLVRQSPLDHFHNRTLDWKVGWG